VRIECRGETSGITSDGGGALSIYIPIPPILPLVAGQEPPRTRIIVTVPQQHQPRIGVGLVPKRAPIPKRALPSPGRGVGIPKRVERLRGRDRLVRDRLRFGVLEPGVVPGRSPRPPFRGPRRVVRRAVVQHRVGHIRAVAQEGPRPGRIHLRDPRVVTVSIPFSKSALDFFDK
jgi:hypothetical protein